MGTVASLDLRGHVAADAVDEAFAWLHEVDRRFSPYRDDSEVCRLARGELAPSDSSADLREVLRLCEDVRAISGGAFDAGAHRDDGRLDPTGLVKGWAVERAALILSAAGAEAFSLSVGGDVVCRGEPEPGRPWRVGVRHPDRADAVAAVLGLRDLAVATSGAYERGRHIIDGRTGRPAAGLRSVTVVGPRLTLADAYATAAFAMGSDGPAWVAAIPGYGVGAVTERGSLVVSELFSALLLPGRA